MSLLKIGKAMRLFFLVITALIGLGIWLSGFKTVHWFLYVPPALLLMAAITGICPGMFVTRKITGEKSAS